LFVFVLDINHVLSPLVVKKESYYNDDDDDDNDWEEGKVHASYHSTSPLSRTVM